MKLFPSQIVGPLSRLLSAISLSVAALAIRHGSSMDDGSSFDVLIVVLITNVLILTPAAIVIYYPDYGLTLRAIGAFAAAGLAGTGFGQMGCYKAIELVGAARAEPIKSSMPLYATLFAVFLLGETVSLLRGSESPSSSSVSVSSRGTSPTVVD